MVQSKAIAQLTITLIITLSVLLSEMAAQTKFWVQFSNKDNTPYNLNNGLAFLTFKSMQRRANQGIALHPSDLPVTPSYITQVDAVPNVTVNYASKWFNGVVVTITNTTVLNAINSLSFVSSYTPVNRYKRVGEEELTEPPMTQEKLSSVSSPSAYYGGAYWQNKQLGVQCLHDLGYRGQGMTIAVLDAGFQNVNTNPVFDSLRNRGGILGTYDIVTGGTSVYEDDSHGAAVLSCMAAIKPNVIVGSAPRADYWLLRTEDAATEKMIEEFNWIRGAEYADSVGADILTTSLGYTTFDNPVYNHTFAHLNGKTAKMSIAATMASRKGMFVLNSAGNGGGSSWPKIGIPADADSICTVGAIDTLYNVTGFSSVGPTADGRIKPELVARGGKSWVAFPNGSCGYSNGTSFSCPILAGAVACFWQAFPSMKNIKVLDTLKKTATFSLTPNNSRGWGTTNMCLFQPIVTQLQKNAITSGFEIFPNPASNIITVKLTESSKQFQIRILNIFGSLMLTKQSDGNEVYNVDLSELPKGLYFVEVVGTTGNYIQKLIKE